MQEKGEFEERVINGLGAIYKMLSANNQLLERIAIAVEKAADSNTKGARFMRKATEYKSFNWDAIGAEVIRRDRDDLPDLVKWKELIYTRRAKSEQDGNIWFSRHVCDKEYDVLIRFIEPQKSKRLDIE